MEPIDGKGLDMSARATSCGADTRVCRVETLLDAWPQ